MINTHFYQTDLIRQWLCSIDFHWLSTVFILTVFWLLFHNLTVVLIFIVQTYSFVPVRSPDKQVFVAALAARRECIQLLHGAVTAWSTLCLHGVAVCWTCGRVSTDQYFHRDIINNCVCPDWPGSNVSCIFYYDFEILMKKIQSDPVPVKH